MPPTTELKPGTTSPCPGCGRPVLLTAMLCTHCGQQVRAGIQLETAVGKPEHTAPPPIPVIAPGPGKFRAAPGDENGRRILQKSILLILLCTGIVMGWKALEVGPAEAAAYAARLGITTGGACILCLLESMVFLEIGVNILLAILGIAAAVSTANLAQHIISYTAIPTLAWIVGAFVCIMCLADLLDIELPDAVFLTLPIWLMKAVLTWTLFANMFDAAK